MAGGGCHRNFELAYNLSSPRCAVDMVAEKHGGGMFHREERSLREQLIDARVAIAAQLDRMACGDTVRRPPDFSREIAELESQLREIDDLLRTGEESAP